MLQKLYIPEIEVEHATYNKARATFLVWLAEGKVEIVGKQKTPKEHVPISKEHLEGYDQLLKNLEYTISEIEKKIKVIASSLNNA